MPLFSKVEGQNVGRPGNGDEDDRAGIFQREVFQVAEDFKVFPVKIGVDFSPLAAALKSAARLGHDADPAEARR